MKSVLLLIAVIVCSVTALPANNERIFEGDLAKSGEFPYVVSITENDRHFCGGFIYSEKWIVTTASCVEGKTAGKLKVVVGQISAITPDPDEQTLAVYTITPFSEYNSTTKANDIALLRLSANITFDANVPPNVDFVAYNELDTTSDPAPSNVTIGWGATFDGGLESVNLHSGDIAIVTLPDKNAPCGTFDPVSTGFNFATMICASNDPNTNAIRLAGSPCQYDEGSPLVQINAEGIHTAVGILSRLDGCSATAHSVYTRVSIFYSWLINTAGQQPTQSITLGGK